MDTFIQWLQSNPFVSIDLANKVLGTLIIVFAIWLIRRWVLAIATRRIGDLRKIYNFRRRSASLATILGLIIIGLLWMENARQMITYLGLLSAGVAIALKEPLTNLVGWAYIGWQKPFKIGDRIQIGTYAGDVIDINLFQISLMEIGNWVAADQSTGRIVHIPNSQIFLQPQVNATEEFEYLWNEIPITITYESDWEQAKEILLTITAENAPQEKEVRAALDNRKDSKYLYFYHHISPIIYSSIADVGITLTIRYMCGSRQRRSSAAKIQEEALTAFTAHPKIEFAYPTHRSLVEATLNPNPNPAEENTNS
jgi:small-conductance mechanosensitive channel